MSPIKCHDLLAKCLPKFHNLLMSINLSDIAILNIKGSDYCFIISLISKTEAINLLQNVDWTEKGEHYKKVENYKLKILIFESIYRNEKNNDKIC